MAQSSSQTAGWSLQLASEADIEQTEFQIAGSKPLTLGRSSDVDLVVPLHGISRQHAELQLEKGKLCVRDLGSRNGTYLNDTKIVEEFARPGDCIRFDEIRFWVHGPEDGDEAEATTLTTALADADIKTDPGGATQAITITPGLLVGQGGPVDKQEFPLTSLVVTIGRDEDNDLVLDYPSVSGRHAELSYVGGRWLVRDLDSSNGTFVDGERVNKTNLKVGQVLSVADICLEYRLYQSPPKEQQAPVAALAAAATAEATQKGPNRYLVAGLALAIALALWIYPPSWLAPLLPRSNTIDDIRDYTDQVTAEMSGEVNSPELEFTPPWPSLSLPRERIVNTPQLADINNDQFADILLSDSQGYSSVINGRTGETLFAIRGGGKVLAPPAQMRLAEGPAMIISRYSGQIDALGARGQTLWQSAQGLELGALIQRPMVVDVNGDRQADILLTSEGKGLVALDGDREGWLLWHTADLTRGRLTAQPLASDINGDGGIDFVTVSDSGQVLAVGIDAGAPVKLWEQQLAPILFAAPALLQTAQTPLVAVATHEDQILVLSGATGALVWQRAHPKALYASLLGADLNGDRTDDLLAVAHDGEVTAINGVTGETLWQVSVDAAVQASPALFDFNYDKVADILVADAEGSLHFIDGRRGEALTDSLDIEGADSFVASPVLGDVNGDLNVDIVAVSQNGRLTVMGVNRRLGSGRAGWNQFLGNNEHRYQSR
jgi:pSer/pThr/pTyr-binding forkhead associated (FHA) protein